MVSADDKVVVEMHPSGGECHDAPQGRVSIRAVGSNYGNAPILMDSAYEGDETRMLSESFGCRPIVPPKKSKKELWDYDRETYRKRNVVERLFRRVMEFGKVFTRYDKTDVMFMAVIKFAFIRIRIK